MRLIGGSRRALLSTQSLPTSSSASSTWRFRRCPPSGRSSCLRDSADEALDGPVFAIATAPLPPTRRSAGMVVRRVMRERVAILATDATTDPGLVTDSILRFNIRSFMCAPLWSRESHRRGVRGQPEAREFNSGRSRRLHRAHNAAAVAIEQARLSQPLLEETRRRERLQRYHSPAVVSRIIHARRRGDCGSGRTGARRHGDVL